MTPKQQPRSEEKGKLCPASIENWRDWADRLSYFREDFAQSGFNVPYLDLALIEGIRERGPNERDYGEYLTEVLKESFALPDGIWTVETRKSLPLSKRSSYLDFLAAAFENGDFGTLGDSRIPTVLDPNYMLYTSLKVRDRSSWQGHIDTIRNRKEHEIEQLRGRLDTLCSSTKTTTNNFVQMLVAVSEQLHLDRQVFGAGDKRKVLLCGKIDDAMSMCLEWSDPHVLRKWGALQIRYVVQETKPRVGANAEDNPPAVFETGLGGLVPGGNWYTWSNMNSDAVALGILAHASFLAICTRTRP